MNLRKVHGLRLQVARRLTSNCTSKMKAPKQQKKYFPKAKNHNCEFHPRIHMKKGTTRDFSRMIYGPKPCKPHLHINQKPKSIKEYSNMKPLNRKDRRQRQHFDISKAFLHSPSNEPALSIPNKKEEVGVQSTFSKDGMMGDWFIREFGEWFHTDKAKVHREQLKHRGEMKLT
jgi:hypothetical protein